MALTYLAIGSNSGEREVNIKISLEEIGKRIGKVLFISSVYESQSWGYEGNNFLNLVTKVETLLSPSEILKAIHETETALGRIKVPGKYTDRTIDIDIVFYENEIINTEELKVPHPQFENRLFVLLPMLDLDPDFIHPVLHKSIRQLKDTCTDKGWIIHYGDIKQ